MITNRTQPPTTVLLGNTAGVSSVAGAYPAYFSGGANVTLSGLSDAGAYTLAIIGAAGGTGGGAGIALGAGTQTATTNTVALANSNGVTFGMSGSSQITASVETAYAASTHSHGNPSLALTNLSGTTASASNGLTISLSAAAPGAGGGIAAAAGTQTATSGTVAFANSNGLTFGMSGSSQITGSHNGLTTARASNDAVGLATAATSVTWTVNSAGISLNAGAYLTTAQPPGAYLTTARASNDAVGLATAATSVTWTVNSAGISLNAGAYLTTAANSTHSHGNPTLALTNLSGTTASNSAGLTLSLSAAAPGAGGGIAAAAGTETQTSGTLVFANSNGVTFGMSGSSQITASVNAGGGAAPARRYIEIQNGERFTTIANLSETRLTNRLLLFPFWLDGTDLNPKTVRVFVTGIASSNRSLGQTYRVGLYSQVNDTQISLLASDSVGFNITATSQSSVWNGFRAIDFTRMSSVTMTTEGRWVLGWVHSNSANNTTVANVAIYGGDPMPAYSGQLIDGTSQASNSQSQIFPWWGGYNVGTTNGFPSSIGATQVNGNVSASLLDIYAVIKEI